MPGTILKSAAWGMLMISVLAPMIAAQEITAEGGPWVRIPTKCDPIPRPHEMIRSVTTSRGTVRLGERLPRLLRRGSPGDSLVYWEKGVMRHADVLGFFLADERVRSIQISYDPDSVRFDTLARNYQRQLGRVPLHSLRQPAGIRTVARCWHDARTLFRVAGVIGLGQGEASIELYDLPNGYPVRSAPNP